jgi:hypothetical protein
VTENVGGGGREEFVCFKAYTTIVRRGIAK